MTPGVHAAPHGAAEIASAKSSATASPGGRSHPLVRLDFVVRLVGCPIAAAMVVTARAHEPTPAWMWSVLAFHALVWPHLARAISSRSDEPVKVELRLLVLDAVIAGAEIPFLSFRVVPTLAFLVAFISILGGNGGVRLLAVGLPSMALSSLVSGALLSGFRVDTTPSPLNTVISAGMMLGFQTVLGVQTFLAARRLAQSRRQVKEQAEQIRSQNVELVKTREEALQAARAKAAFLATMSHEIRTPLNGVLGMTRLLSETRLDAEQRDYLRTIQVSGVSLLAVINDILDYSRIESGRLTIESEPLRVSEAIEESFEIVAERAREKGLELLYDVAPDVPSVIAGDITRLRQVLTNLVGNAVKFTEKGEVFVEVRLARAESAASPAEIAFDVRDTGIGIPEDRIPQLFSAFTQVDASTTRRYGGTGLGLAISKRLTELMGGTIRVESAPEEGSSFCFTIQARAAELPAAQALKGGPVRIAGRRVLIVDDGATNRRVLAAQLAAWGFATRSTDGARAALEALAEESFDVAVLDLHMPDVDGLTLARRIRERPGSDHLPLVLLSSSVLRSKDDPDHLFAAHLTKPARQSKLFDALMVALAGPEAEAMEAAAPAGPHRLAEIASLRILVADDNDVNRQLAGLIMRRFGYAAEYASDGREALARVLQAADGGGPYDVVFMDVHMPEMDGLEATAAIRGHAQARPEVRWPRIVAVTADAMQGDRERCLEAGMDDYLTKPLDFDAVQRVLEAVATGAAARTPAPSAAEAPPALTSALIDWSRLDELVEYDTPEGDVVRSAVASFVQQASVKLELVRGSVARSDGAGLRESAHAIKGAAGNIGAAGVAEFASRLETAGRSGSFEGAGDLVTRLSGALDQTIAELGARFPAQR